MGLFDWLLGGGGNKTAISQIDPATANDRVRKKEMILVDVRTESEWQQGGVPKGAHTITLGDPLMVDTVYGLMKEDASKPVAVICRSGMRSARAAKLLAAAGFADVSNVRGGMMAWTSANLPVKQYRR